MAYSKNIPQPTDVPGESQNLMLQNFQKLDDDFAIDHESYTSGTNNGFHKKVTFKEPLAADPNLAPLLGSLFTKNIAGAAGLFFQNGTTANKTVPLSTFVISGTPAKGSIQIGNIVINFGVVTATTSAVAHAVQTAVSQVLTAHATGSGTTDIVALTASSTTSVTIKRSNNNATDIQTNYLHIGFAV